LILLLFRGLAARSRRFGLNCEAPFHDHLIVLSRRLKQFLRVWYLTLLVQIHTKLIPLVHRRLWLLLKNTLTDGACHEENLVLRMGVGRRLKIS